MNVKVFGGHREASVNSLSSTSPTSCPSFIANFTSCDSKGFVATWDIRSPKRMAHCSLPFLMTLMNRQKNSNNKNNSNDDDDVIEIQEVVNCGEHFTVALSEDDIAMIDWRKPKVPVWTYSSSSSASSSFSCCFNRMTQQDIVVFHDEGQVSIIDQKTGTLKNSSPESLAERDEMQLPCGVSSLSATMGGGNNHDDRFAVVASTFGTVSVLDLNTWSITGSVALGGMKEKTADDDQEQQQKTSVEKMTNPPLLASLSCLESPFVIGTGAQHQNNEDDSSSPIDKKSSSLISQTALVSRADGVVVFAHIQPNTYPAATRLVDITTTDLSHSLCSANWIRHCPNTSSSSAALISCVGTNGVVSLWQVPSAGFDLADNDEEDQDQENNENDNENEDDEATLMQLDEINLLDIKYTANEPQKQAVRNSAKEGIEVNCSCVISTSSSSGQGVVVGDTAGRILCVEVPV